VKSPGFGVKVTFASSGGRETMANERILIAEDDGIIAARLQSILTKMGYTVPTVVASGEEALRQAAEAPPDLALMDIGLAGNMDGIQAGGQMHARWGIPLIYLTAYMNDSLLQRARQTEPYGYWSSRSKTASCAPPSRSPCIATTQTAFCTRAKSATAPSCPK
jgi:CheY-like chemotaxis protein